MTLVTFLIGLGLGLLAGVPVGGETDGISFLPTLLGDKAAQK